MLLHRLLRHLKAAVLAGRDGALGFGAVFLAFAVSAFLTSEPRWDLLLYLALIVVSALVAAFVLYTVGVAVLGPAIKAGLRCIGRTDALSAALFGAAVSAAVAEPMFLGPHVDFSDFIQIGGVAFGGALAGLGYRKNGRDVLS